MGIPIREGPARARCMPSVSGPSPTLRDSGCFTFVRTGCFIYVQKPLTCMCGAGESHTCCQKDLGRSDDAVTSLKESNGSVGGRIRSLAPGLAHAAPWSVLARVEAAVQTTKEMNCVMVDTQTSTRQKSCHPTSCSHIPVCTHNVPVAAPLFADCRSCCPDLAALIAFGCSRVKCYQTC
jgi:hypothetical protein